ncbi:hypothetical protein C0J52_11790, partial [Blattella germanica]
FYSGFFVRTYNYLLSIYILRARSNSLKRWTADTTDYNIDIISIDYRIVSHREFSFLIKSELQVAMKFPYS